MVQSTLRLGNAIKQGRRISTSSSTRGLASSSIRTNCFINPDNHYMPVQLCSVWTSTPSQTKTLSNQTNHSLASFIHGEIVHLSSYIR